MANYYFKIHDCMTYFDDVELDLPDDHTAISEALRTAGQILSDGAARPQVTFDFSIKVSNSHGACVVDLRVSWAQPTRSDSRESVNATLEPHGDAERPQMLFLQPA